MKELISSPTIIIKFIVLLTFLHAIFRLKTKKRINRYLFYILGISAVVELINGYLQVKEISFAIFSTFRVVLITIFWFCILYMIFSAKRLIIATIVIFSLFALFNLLFIEGPIEFNYYTLIAGAFLYCISFVFESFLQLKRDNFYFFQSNKYILIFSPIIFFIGLSFLFLFKNTGMTSGSFYENVKLYTYVNSLVNVVFYLSLNYYILKEKR